ncbi:MAG: LemA-like protein [uncultured marine phage]|uniref:LemA-like protein n=1 Tax=uncultured marine phage TaxID=707152 RepID=A0A8D9FR58_9VIRU|nr:MAG: LemA-like protein [uncultured marine phage]
MDFIKKNWKPLLVAGILFVMYLFVNPIGSYNNMVTNDENTQTAWSNVEAAYQERNDLIPNLVNIVKGYAAHEKETYKAITDARSNATQTTIDPSNMTTEQFNDYMDNQDQLTSALSKLLMIVENYPDLKASENFRDLQSQLEGSENRIRVERMNYNEFAKVENTYMKKFPKNILNNMFCFEEKPYFKSEEGAETAPEISFE